MSNDIVSIIVYHKTSFVIIKEESIQTVQKSYLDQFDTLDRGGTCYYPAIDNVATLLENESSQYSSYEKSILFLSDGGDACS